MMIDVVRPDRGPRDTSQQIVFFVGSAVRTIKTDGIRAALLTYRGQAHGCLSQSLFPARRLEPAAEADQRLVQSLVIASEFESESALGTQKITVVAGEIAIIDAEDFMVAHAERRFAAIGTVGAHGRHVLHLPGSCVIAIGAAGQRAHRAYIDAHAALDAFQMVFALGSDH